MTNAADLLLAAAYKRLGGGLFCISEIASDNIILDWDCVE